MSEAKWKRVNDKKYQRLVGDEWVSVDMPYGKVELIFNEFIGEGGLIDPATGFVATDLPTLIGKFGKIGGIVLTEFDSQGEVKTIGNTKVLDPCEIPPLFEIAVCVIENFTKAISVIQGAVMTAEGAEAKESKPKGAKKAA
jgi:hypothetical protein